MTLGDLVDLLQQRIPIGLSDQYCKDRLNEAFRWIAQQESFVFFVRRTQVAVATTPNPPEFAVPTDFDPGDIALLYGETYKQPIPFIPVDQWANQEIFNNVLPSQMPFSAWTLIQNGSGVYKGKLAPDTVQGIAITLNLFYHINAPQLSADGDSYPSPSEYESTICDLAEARVKQTYSIAGWQDVQARALESVKSLVQDYRSDKRYIEGLASETLTAQEAQVKRAT